MGVKDYRQGGNHSFISLAAEFYKKSVSEHLYFGYEKNLWGVKK